MIRSLVPQIFASAMGRRLVAAVAVVVAIAAGASTVRWTHTRIIAPRAVFRGHHYAIRTVAFTPDGRTLASAGGLRGAAAELNLWGTDASQARSGICNDKELIECVAFSPDGKTLAGSGSDGTVHLWSVDGLRERAVLKGHTQEALLLAFSPDGKTLASAGRDQTVRFWKVAKAREQAVFIQPPGWWILSLLFAKDRPLILMAQGTTGNLVLWDVWQAKEVATFARPTEERAAQIVSVALSPDGQTLAAGTTEGLIWLWDRSTGRSRLTWQAHDEMVTALAFSADGAELASGGMDGSAKLWQTDKEREIALLQGHQNAVTALAFSPDGKQLVSGGEDTMVVVWEVPLLR
jgi:WD40 repeat protein